MNIVSLTACCVDYYPQISKSFLGGNSLNFTANARRLEPDIEIAVITSVGTDENGKRIRDFLLKNSVSITYLYVKEGNSSTNQIINDTGGERFGVPGSWNGGVGDNFFLSEDDWSFVLDHDIIAIPANNQNFQTLLRKKKKNNFVVVDFLDVENNIPIEKYIEHVDVAFIAGREHLLSNYQKIAFAYKKLLVVTLGALGSVAFQHDEVYKQKALPIPKVIDTTGCGDSYQAAFTVTYYRTKNIPKAMEAGALSASRTVQHFGGVGV
jgi:sugar/nucleoside kinase (ribokinase family)